MGVSASPPFTPRVEARAEASIASISTSSATKLALALAFEFAASVSTVAGPDDEGVSIATFAGGFAGTREEERLGGDLNFFSIVASSSGSSSRARFDPAPAGTRGGRVGCPEP